VIVVLVPWRPTPDREPLWQWVHQHLSRLGYPIHTGDSDTEIFSLARGFNAAADRPWDKAILSEADVFVDLTQITEALEVPADLTYCYDAHLRLDPGETDQLLHRSVLPRRHPTAAQSRMGSNGVRVVTRRLWDQLTGYDPGFVGWGAEDNDFLARARALTDPKRIPGIMYELHHERDPSYLAAVGENRRRLQVRHG